MCNFTLESLIEIETSFLTILGCVEKGDTESARVVAEERYKRLHSLTTKKHLLEEAFNGPVSDPSPFPVG